MTGARRRTGAASEVAPAVRGANGEPTGAIASRAWPDDRRLGARAPGLPDPAYLRVREFVEDHLGARISLDDLAGVAGVSRFHFARQFRLRTGRSPMAYVLRSRVERAMELLRAGTSSVGEVAAALAFADQSHFTRTFRRFVGTSPGRFANWHRDRDSRRS